MEGYRTVKTVGKFCLTEKRSEFIGTCAPVKNEAEAWEFVNSVRKQYSDAKHNVYAFSLREGFTARFSDDGEPHGTAGMPVLDAIRKSGIIDVAIVVTRYFGGILLGTGGLVRAYSAAAAGAIISAGAVDVGVFNVFCIEASYSDKQRLMPVLAAHNVKTDSEEYGDIVRMVLLVPPACTDKFISAVADATGGRCAPVQMGEKCDFLANT